jgi:hypothetical protein
MSALLEGPLWPYLLVVLAGFLPTEIWRSLAVMLARNLDEESEWLIYVRAVATAIVAGVVARLVLFPAGDLVTVPLGVRLAAVAAGLGFFFFVRRILLLAVIAGEAVLIAGAWWYAGR